MEEIRERYVMREALKDVFTNEDLFVEKDKTMLVIGVTGLIGSEVI